MADVAGKKRKIRHEHSSLERIKNKKRKVNNEASCVKESVLDDEDTVEKQETQRRLKKKKRGKSKSEEQSDTGESTCSKKKKVSTKDLPVNSASLLANGRVEDAKVPTSSVTFTSEKKDKHSKSKKHKSSRDKEKKRKKSLSHCIAEKDSSNDQDISVSTCISSVGASQPEKKVKHKKSKKYKSDGTEKKRKTSKHKNKSLTVSDTSHVTSNGEPHEHHVTESHSQELEDQLTETHNEQATESHDNHMTEGPEGNAQGTSVTEHDNHWRKKHQEVMEEIKRYINDGAANSDDFRLIDYEDPYAGIHEKIITTTSGLKELAEAHPPWNKGRWTADEEHVFKRNIKAFLKENSIKNFVDLFLSKSDDRTKFIQNVAKGINRPLFQVYRKMRRIFDNNNYIGKWTPEQDAELLRLVHIHGNAFITIGQAMELSGQTCRDRYRRISKKNIRKGVWNDDESDCLKEALEHYRGYDWKGGDCDLPEGVTWEMVANRVGTRTAHQCRSHWTMLLSWKCQGGWRKWNVVDDVHLLETLNEAAGDDDIETEDDIDWEKISIGWTNSRTQYYLRTKWASLKRSVPQYQSKSFRDNLEYLLTNKLPILKSELVTEDDL